MPAERAKGVTLERRGAIATIAIDNPGRRNAMDLAMWIALSECVRAAARDAEVRAIVLRGAGDEAFCAGADIAEFASARADADSGRRYERANVDAFDALAQAPKPVIAAIRGFCLGGGMGLAAACDLRLGERGARFGIPAGRLGVGYPPAAMAYIVAAVGPAQARDLFYVGRRLDAAEAFRIGFLDRIVDGADFESALADLVGAIAEQAPLTLRAAKAAIARASTLPGAPSLQDCERLADACLASADYQEGRSAFLEKRAPRFRGR